MPDFESIKETKKIDSINNGMGQSMFKEVKESLGHKEIIDDLYKKIETGENKNIQDFLSMASNKGLFYTISSKILDKLTQFEIYGQEKGEKIFEKGMIKTLNKVVENKILFFDEEIDVLTKMTIEYSQGEEIEETKKTKKHKNEAKNNLLQNKQENNQNKQENNQNKQENNQNIKKGNRKLSLVINKNLEDLDGLYTDFDTSLKPTDAEINAEQAKEGNKPILKILKEKFGEISKKIKNYFKFLIVAKKLTSNPDKKPTEQEEKFVNSFNILSKDLGLKTSKIEFAYFIKHKEDEEIRSKKLELENSGSISKFSDISDKEILENKNIKNFLESDISNNEGLSFEFSDDEIKDILSPYAKQDPQLAKLLEHVDDKGNINIKGNNPKEISDIKKKIKDILESYKNRTKQNADKIVKERVITTCFRSFGKYFDITNKNMENFADMQINAENGINMDGQELYITGSIQGKHIGLHYDMATGVVKMDDFMAYDHNKNGYVMGRGNGMTKTMEFKLPTYDSLVEDAYSTDIVEISKRSDSPKDFDDRLKTKLDTKLSKNFGDNAVNKFFVEREMEKNLLEQEIIGDIFTNRNKNNKDITPIDINNQAPIKIDQSDQRYKLLKLIDTTLRDTDNANELLSFRNSLREFDKFINKKEVREGRSKDGEINSLFDKKSMESSMENRKQKNKEDPTRDNKELNYYTFFSRMTKTSKTGDPKINIAKFNILVKKLDNQKTLDEAIDIPHDDKYKSIADNLLENNLKSVKNIA